MNVQQTKASIFEKLEKTNNELLLRKIEALLDTNDETVAGYKPNGDAYTYGMLREDIAESEQEFEVDGGTTQQELRSQIKSWRKG